MERKKGTSESKSSKVDHADDNEHWQIDPLADYKKSIEKVENKKQKENDEKGTMGFDKWSVTWP